MCFVNVNNIINYYYQQTHNTTIQATLAIYVNTDYVYKMFLQNRHLYVIYIPIKNAKAQIHLV